MDSRANLRLLVVEDEAMVAMTLIDVLEDLGHAVIGRAADVAQALDLVARHGRQVDACILDANLSGTSSAPVAAALRAAGIPYLLTSGYEGDDLARFGFDAPALQKPYDCDDLDSALGSLHR